MNKEDAIKLITVTKAISAFTRNFVEWLYKNDYVILSPKEHDKLKEWHECAKTCGWNDTKGDKNGKIKGE